MDLYLKTLCDLLDLTNDKCCKIYRCSNVNSNHGRIQFDDFVKIFSRQLECEIYRADICRNRKKMESHSKILAIPNECIAKDTYEYDGINCSKAVSE